MIIIISISLLILSSVYLQLFIPTHLANEIKATYETKAIGLTLLDSFADINYLSSDIFAIKKS